MQTIFSQPYGHNTGDGKERDRFGNMTMRLKDGARYFLAYKHAVTSTSNGNSYSYDANGNQTSRRVGGTTYTLIYDAENRLVQIKRGSNIQATYTYDGDGNRVKTVVGSTTTAFVGNYLEWTGSTATMKMYYYAGGQRVAMRQGSSTLYYLLTDHLGSTAITATSGGGFYTELRYYPWGGTRYSSGTTPTSFRYTGQREAEVGLYYYGARFYDPQLGRFVQSDSIIPSPSHPVAWDRYAYTANNPIKYTDPSGHGYCDSNSAAEDVDCSYTTEMILNEFYGVTLTGTEWTEAEINAIYEGVSATGRRLASAMSNNSSAPEAFKAVFGNMEFEMYDGQCAEGCWGRAIDAHHIRFYRHYTESQVIEDPDNPGEYLTVEYEVNTSIIQQLVVHELGHSFEKAVTGAGGKLPSSHVDLSHLLTNRDGLAVGLWEWQQSTSMEGYQIFADMFIGWVYNVWYSGSDSDFRDAGRDRWETMNSLMSTTWLNNFK